MILKKLRYLPLFIWPLKVLNINFIFTDQGPVGQPDHDVEENEFQGNRRNDFETDP